MYTKLYCPQTMTFANIEDGCMVPEDKQPIPTRDVEGNVTLTEAVVLPINMVPDGDVQSIGFSTGPDGRYVMLVTNIDVSNTDDFKYLGMIPADDRTWVICGKTKWIVSCFQKIMRPEYTIVLTRIKAINTLMLSCLTEWIYKKDPSVTEEFRGYRYPDSAPVICGSRLHAYLTPTHDNFDNMCADGKVHLDHNVTMPRATLQLIAKSDTHGFFRIRLRQFSKFEAASLEITCAVGTCCFFVCTLESAATFLKQHDLLFQTDLEYTEEQLKEERFGYGENIEHYFDTYGVQAQNKALAVKRLRAAFEVDTVEELDEAMSRM